MREVNARWAVVECFGVVLARLSLGELTFHLRLNDEWLNLAPGMAVVQTFIYMTVDECISPLLNMVSVYRSRCSLYIWASLVAQTVKRLPTMREMRA